MTSQVKLKISWGLVALVIINAILIVAFDRVTDQTSRPATEAFALPASRYEPVHTNTQFESMREAPAVNLDAQQEIKQAGPCLPCQKPSHPQWINGERVVHWGPIVPTSQPAVPFDRVVYPATTSSPPLPPGPSTRRHQIALFVDSTAESHRLKSWFDSDPELMALRQKCEFQIFTSNNTLYRTRYASKIPASQFPVVLFTDPTGGHIHAAGGPMIPDSPGKLYADMAKGFELYKEAKQGTARQTGTREAGAIKSSGYSWDASITPNLRMSDCPGGQCPTPDQSWRPFDRVRPDGGTFLDGQPLRNALVWTNSNELLTLTLCGIAVVLLIYVLNKHRGR